MADSTAAVPSKASKPNRWVILLFSILSMVAVANFHYGWTLFVPPLQKHLKMEQALIRVTFTVFVLVQTWLVPFEGWLVDKFGPRRLLIASAIFLQITSDLPTTRPMTSAMQARKDAVNAFLGKTVLDTELTEMMIQMFVH